MRRKVLVADDEKDFLDLLSDILEASDYDVIRCISGIDALQLYSDNQETIDLVITDFKMDDLNGLDLIANVRSVNDNVPIMMVSGYAKDEIENIDQKNISNFFFYQKPVDFEIFLKKVMDLLGIEYAA